MTPCISRTAALIVTVLSAALAWTPPERVDRKPEGYRTYLPALAVGPDGVVHAVWSESPGTGFLQKVIYCRRQGDTWTIPLNVSRDSGDIRTPAIALDSSGQALVVWSEESYARMRYVRRLGDTWSSPKPCFAQHGVIPRVAVDSRNRVHMLFGELGGQSAVWYTLYVPSGDSWATPSLVADDSAALGWQDLAVDRDDHLHAVWMNYRTWGIDYSRNDGSGWSAPVALPDPAPEGQSCDPRIACDTSGRPHVVWEERSGGYFVYYSWLEGDSWTTPYRVDEQSGLRPVLACDDPGNTHVIWRNTGLWHIVRSDSGWSEPRPVSSSGGGPQIEFLRSELHLIFETESWQILYSQHEVSGIEEARQELRGRVGLSVAVHANRLQVSFCLESPGRVLVQVLDSAGRVVTGREAGWLDAGSHELTIPAEGLAGGAYLCRVTAGGEVVSAKLTIVR